MSNAVIHIAHKLWIIGGVLTLCLYEKDTKGRFGNKDARILSMITLNGPTVQKVIYWLIGNWKHLDPEKYDRIIKQAAIDEEEKQAYLAAKKNKQKK